MAKVNHKAEKSTSSNMENVIRLQECHTQEMIMQHTETQAAEASGAMSVMPRIPSIKMRETEKNCWEVVLTEEERELINEFLET